MMSVEEATRVACEEREDAIAVLTMSAIAYWDDVREDDYRLMGLMGGAASIGLGLALGIPDRPVWVLDGDGSLLMQLGVLTAVAGAAPANLTHLVMDNGIYAISGGQPMPGGCDWEGLFRSAGYASATTVASPDALRDALRAPADGPRAIAVHVVAERPAYPAGAFAVRPAEEASRVRRALAGARRTA